MSIRRKRRPANWFTVLETSAAQWSVAVSTIIVMVVIGIVLWQLGGSAALLSNTTTTGGDTAAHYLMPQVLSHFLQSGHLTGWYSGWYDGLPLYSFYFVLPDLFVAVASHVIPYNVAFKLATAMGSILLPLACYGLAKGFKLRRPFPELFAAASLLVLFEQSYTIDGGNLYSTMAGEYSYSLSLALVVGFLGLAASGLRSGRRYVAASILLAAALAAHALPIFTAMLGLGLLVLFDLVNPGHLDDDGLGLLRRRGMKPRSRRTRASVVRWAASVCALGFSAMAWWLLPFVANQRYANPMGYVNAADPGSLLWPGGDRWAVWLVGVGVVVAFSLRSRVGIFLVVMTIESGAAVVLDPQGSIYNARLLPPYFLFLYLSAAWTFGVLGVNVATGIRQWRMARFAARPLERRRPRDRRVAPGALSVGLQRWCSEHSRNHRTSSTSASSARSTRCSGRICSTMLRSTASVGGRPTTTAVWRHAANRGWSSKASWRQLDTSAPPRGAVECSGSTNRTRADSAPPWRSCSCRRRPMAVSIPKRDCSLRVRRRRRTTSSTSQSSPWPDPGRRWDCRTATPMWPTASPTSLCSVCGTTSSQIPASWPLLATTIGSST